MGDRPGAGQPAAACVGLAHVPAFERQQPGVPGELGEVGLVALDQVVDRQDLVSAIQQLADHPAADEAGRPGDEDLHPATTSALAVVATMRRTSSSDIASTPSDRYGPTGAGSAPAYASRTAGGVSIAGSTAYIAPMSRARDDSSSVISSS